MPTRRLVSPIEVCCLAALILASCSNSPARASQLLSARATVTAYFQAVNAHQWAKAKPLLSPDLQTEFTHSPDSDRNNTLSVTDLKIYKMSPAPVERDAYPNYRSFEQAIVSFHATYKKVYAVTDGFQTRFVYLGRVGTNDPWSILGIGTGP
jgi:hypothetical protein